MVTTMQTFVQRRTYALLLALVSAGFILVFGEMLAYRHWQGLQLLGLATPVIGTITALLGIGASAGRRRRLAVVLLALALVGVLGMWFHNADRVLGEQERQPPAAQTTNGQAAQPRPAGAGRRIPPPILAPLSLSGFCLLGTVVLLSKKDE